MFVVVLSVVKAKYMLRILHSMAVKHSRVVLFA